jgi:hypothetical protein
MSPLLDGTRKRLKRFLPATRVPGQEALPETDPSPLTRQVRGEGRTAPKETSERVVRTDRAWREATDEWLNLDARIKNLEALRSKVADTLADLAPTGSAVGNGVELIRAWRVGGYDMARLANGLGVLLGALDVFRKPSRLITTVRRLRGAPSSGTRPDVGAEHDADRTIRVATFEREGEEQ